MDKEFFEENVKEAKDYVWHKTVSSAILDHQHCIICLIPISGKKNELAWMSDNLWLCDFCHENFCSKSNLYP